MVKYINPSKVNSEKEKYDVLIMKFLTGEASKQETKNLLGWLEGDLENKKYFDEQLAVWKNAGASKAKDLNAENAMGLFLDKHFGNKIQQPKIAMQKPKTNPLLLKRLAVAASILLLVGFSAYFGLKPIAKNAVKIRSKNDIIRYCQLPDGSITSLNSNTSIIYEKNLFNKTRKVYLEGETRFEVKHDNRSPFHVICDSAIIKVLGTSFYVRAYPGDSTIVVYVDSGRVSFVPYNINEKSENKVCEIHTQETLDFNKTTGNVEKKVGKNENLLFWKTGKLSFSGDKLSKVFKTLETAYGVDIESTNPIINDNVVNSTFYNQEIESIMGILTRMYNLNISNVENKYIVQIKECKTID